MTDHLAPDYELDDEITLDDPSQYRALFEPTRMEIVRLLQERAATVTELAGVLGRPKGTIGHHVDALAAAGLVKVVRTRKVRAIEAKYWGRTARTFIFGALEDTGVAPPSPLITAAAEYGKHGEPAVATVRYARVPVERAREWMARVAALAAEFSYQPAAGDVSLALVVGVYRAERPHLPDAPG